MTVMNNLNLIMKNKLLSFLDLYLTFLKIGSFTIGGGLAMMPMMQKELIEKRHWITDEDLIDYYAVGQSTPGIVAVNVSTFVGYKKFGVIGGIFGTLGIVTPSLVIIMILATAINSISEFPRVQAALKGINVAVAALLTSVFVKFVKKTIKNIWHVLLMLAAFICVYAFKLPSFIIILTAILIGVLLTIRTQKELKKQNKEEE